MSFFAASNQAKHLGKVRDFLKDPKSGFSVTSGASITEIYELANAKSSSAEKIDSSFGERLLLAQAYLNMSSVKVARNLGVSRELVRRWRINKSRFLGDLSQLATLLNVPAKWLQFGGEEHLPANSHLGQRLGVQREDAKELLYSQTMSLISILPDDATENELMRAIELNIFASPSLSRLARRAGGRWQIQGGKLLFSPWTPPPKKQQRIGKAWPIVTEDIIREELALKRSIYGAYSEIKARCENLGLVYPARITLHKRASSVKKRELDYGVDLNSRVLEALALACLTKH
jgi:transcriptional regulator with XRE-family HTH domain